MPKLITPLTSAEILNAGPRNKEYNLSDGAGLSLRILPSGSKQWLFNYKKPSTNKRTNLSFGTFPETSLTQARQKRELARGQIQAGLDPKRVANESSQAKTDPNLDTLESVSDAWLRTKNNLSSDHISDIRRSLELHIFPFLGDCPINELSAQQTIRALDSLKNKKSYEMIRRICQRLNQIMNYSVNIGLIEHNCLVGIKSFFPVPVPVPLPALKIEEFDLFMTDVKRSTITHLTRELLFFQLFTMTNSREASEARWHEIDLSKRIWTIPKERMKFKRDHIVPLTEEMLTLLNDVAPYSKGGAYVFPSYTNDHKPMNSQTVNMAIKRMGYKGQLVSHGFRSIASSILSDQGFNSNLIAVALAYVDRNMVRENYNPIDLLEKRRPMMQWWTSYVMNIYSK